MYVCPFLKCPSHCHVLIGSCPDFSLFFLSFSAWQYLLSHVVLEMLLSIQSAINYNFSSFTYSLPKDLKCGVCPFHQSHKLGHCFPWAVPVVVSGSHLWPVSMCVKLWLWGCGGDTLGYSALHSLLCAVSLSKPLGALCCHLLLLTAVNNIVWLSTLGPTWVGLSPRLFISKAESYQFHIIF